MSDDLSVVEKQNPCFDVVVAVAYVPFRDLLGFMVCKEFLTSSEVSNVL